MWEQIYDPFGAPWLSTLFAALPIALLLGSLVLGAKAHHAALLGLASALLVAILGYHMPPQAALAAASQGALFGLLPIGWIVLAAVFLYRLTVASGQFAILQQSIANLSPDRRMQTLMIAFSFGSFIEGAAGFGTPVAISAALMIGLGFAPLQAATLALVANTSPVAFGALGTPIITLARVSGIDEFALSQMAGRQLPLFSLLIPAWLIAILSGWRGVRDCWPAILACGGTFALLQALLANLHGPTLVDVAAGLGSLLALASLLRFWQPPPCPTLANQPATPPVIPHADSALSHPITPNTASPPSPPTLTSPQVAFAWGPWILLSLFVLLWGWPAIKTELNGGTAAHPNLLHGISKLDFPIPFLHNSIYVTAPVADVPPDSHRADKPLPAIYECNWLSATGTAIFLACLVSRYWLRISWSTWFTLLGQTLVQVRYALLTITCMIALAFVTKFGGSDATLGLAFTHTGWLYPFFAPLLGWLGVALTGSDTSSNALFGNLQRITAERLQLNPVLIVASNSTGGVMGKMIDAQSIVVAAVATQQEHQEGRILATVFWHSLLLAAMMGLLTLLQCYAFPWIIPNPQ